MCNAIKTIKLSRTPLLFTRGVTTIELLIVLSVVAIMLALAAPSMRGVTARADIKAAADNVSQAIRMAKNTARVTNRPVTVTFTTGTSGNSISFLFPGQDDMAITTPDIELPDRISVTADPAVIQFNPMGVIVGFDQSSTIVLISTLKSSHAATVSIVNAMGYVTIAEGA